MKGRVLKTIKFKEPVTVINIDSSGITFSNGWRITHYHGQDCCEQVYADWEALQTTGFPAETFTKLDVKGIPSSGIGLNEYFVPCYDIQNGFYSDDLEIRISDIDGSLDIDISDCVKHQID